MFLADGLQQAPCVSALSPRPRVIQGLTSGLESRQKLSVDRLQTLFDERRGIDDVGHPTILLDASVRRHRDVPLDVPGRWVLAIRRPGAARRGIMRA